MFISTKNCYIPIAPGKLKGKDLNCFPARTAKAVSFAMIHFFGNMVSWG